MLTKYIRRSPMVSAFATMSLIVVMSACTAAPTTGQTSTTNPPPVSQTTTVPPSGTMSRPITTQPPVTSGSGFDFILGMSKVLPSVAIIEVTYGAGGAPGQPFAQGAAGTGWVVGANGILATNDHVVTGAQTITVTLADGRKFTSTAVQESAQNDLAVVKIAAQNLPVASIGNSSDLQLGELVAAVGNSLNMGIRITGGLVSRLGTTATYSVTGGGSNITLNNLIETDATINPGNSGGVLIDTLGNVQGIVNAGLEGPSTDIEGFGYAIAINDAMPILNGLISKLP